jgi:hypothetical protein
VDLRLQHLGPFTASPYASSRRLRSVYLLSALRVFTCLLTAMADAYNDGLDDFGTRFVSVAQPMC